MRTLPRAFVGLALGSLCIAASATAAPRSFAPPALTALSASNPLDDAWSDKFGLPIRNGLMRSITSYGGQVVVGGDFTQAGKARAHHVAAWDGTSWHALGDGIPWSVDALIVFGGQLIAAGAKPPLSPSGPSVYVWDGASWSAFGSSDAAVNALAVYGGQLYAGGDFNTMNGVAAARIARWDGSQWQAVGGGITGTGTRSVRAMAVLGTQLVVGGRFSGLQSIAAWDGAAWTSLGAGLQRSGGPGDVYGISTAGTDLLVAGMFDHAGATGLTNIARWNGSAWTAVGTSIQGQLAVGQWLGSPLAMTSISGALRPARWDGVAWASDGSPPLQPFAFYNDGSEVYCGGSGGSTLAPDGFARFDGVTWSVLQEPWAPGMQGLAAYAADLMSYNGSVYAAGPFFFVGADDHWLAARGVASWNGSAWSATPTTPGVEAYSLSTYGGSLVAGGHSWVARLDPGAWTKLGGTISGSVMAMAEHGTDLVAVGDFQTTNGIQRWDGVSWSAIGSGFDVASGDGPTAVVSYGGEIVVGGYLTSSGGAAVHHLVHWTGSAFEDLGGGADGPIATLALSGSDLLVGGDFKHLGGIEAHAAARWNGTAWTPLGDNAEYVTGFREHGGRLFAAGEFIDANGGEAYGAAVWTGDRWFPLGSGVDGLAYRVDFLGDDLYLGGTFGWAYGKPSFNIASLPSVSLVSVGESPRTTALSLIAGPNPSRGSTRFTISLPNAGHVRLTVHDVSGRVVAVLADENRAAGLSFAPWNGRAAPGIYLATIEVGGAKRTTRVVRLD